MSEYRAQWFDPIGQCRRCGKQGHGNLMSDTNSRVGVYCKPCAKKLIVSAHRKHKKFLPDVVYDHGHGHP